MKVKMQAKRVTSEYSQILEVEVPSNYNDEAQFLVEAMSQQGMLNFTESESYEETDYSDNYEYELEDFSEDHPSKQVMVVAPVYVSDRMGSIAAMGRLWSISIDEWSTYTDEEIAAKYKRFLKSQSYLKNPDDKTVFVIVK